jgi:hypothetical protein
MSRRKWNESDLVSAVRESRSIRQVLGRLGLKPTGGNYNQIYKYVSEYGISTSHLKGRGWNRGLRGLVFTPRVPLAGILIKNSTFQSHKLKNRLIREGIKVPMCEFCGWAERSNDGRLPLELHHKNGNPTDNRIENLAILCPNCHSLQNNYRGSNRR